MDQGGECTRPRLLVSYPGVLLSYVCSVPLDTGMSLFTALLFWFTYTNMGYAVEEVEGDLPGRSWLPVLLLFPMLVLTLIMNGRLVFAMCGYSLALVTVLRVKHMPDFRLSSILPLAVAVLLCAVSTGTMLVCIVTSGLLLLSLCGKELSKKPLLLVCLAAALTADAAIYWTHDRQAVRIFWTGAKRDSRDFAAWGRSSPPTVCFPGGMGATGHWFRSNSSGDDGGFVVPVFTPEPGQPLLCVGSGNNDFLCLFSGRAFHRFDVHCPHDDFLLRGGWRAFPARAG